MGVLYRCGSDQRREKVIESADLNGIDCLEVLLPLRLILTFLKSAPWPDLNKDNITIVGGAQSTPVRIAGCEGKGERYTVTLDAPGDLSIYTLRLRKPDHDEPPDHMDSRLSELAFTFRREPPADLGMQPVTALRRVEPEINYLAKDYSSFRRLMLDRLALLLPGGVDDQPADLQAALVELLAYSADHLSYYQDAVATEAYLGTARSRVSLRRHARLLDYRLHEGCNARVWIFCQVNGHQDFKVGDDWRFLTEGSEPIVFEPCHKPNLYAKHNRIGLHTWSEKDFVLRAGATRATLKQDAPNALHLERGDLLIFETLDGTTDPDLHHVVRLTEVMKPSRDPIEEQDIVEVTWGAEDALPFDLKVSCQGTELAVARGNIVLADHGRSIPDQPFEFIPSLSGVPDRLRLHDNPLTWAEPLPPDFLNLRKGDSPTSAAGLMRRDVRAALPTLQLEDDDGPWTARYDLLENGGAEAVFVVETEYDGRAHLRFGDGIHYGRCPTPGAVFTADYRIGTGRAGNVGAEMIRRAEGASVQEVSVRNPLPARGGEDPEAAEQVRLFAPQAFRTQQRAITAADYAARAQSFPGVQRAAAAFRWTGSWYTVYLFVDRVGGRTIDDDFKRRLIGHMDSYRLAGYDLEIRDPTFVPLKIALSFEVKADFTPNAVEIALKEALGNGELSGGRRGHFHPDNWTFGQPVYLSRLYSAALAVPGIAAVDVTEFRRYTGTGISARDQGVLTMGLHEIVQLENDATAPEHGCLEAHERGRA